MNEYFRGKIIPNGINFYYFVFKDLVSDNTKDCSYMTNGGLDIDPYEGVTKKNKCCKDVLCAKCIFFQMNANDRLAYFKYLKKNK